MTRDECIFVRQACWICLEMGESLDVNGTTKHKIPCTSLCCLISILWIVPDKPWLLIPWFHVSPGHQQWLHRIHRSLYTMIKDFIWANEWTTIHCNPFYQMWRMITLSEPFSEVVGLGSHNVMYKEESFWCSIQFQNVKISFAFSTILQYIDGIGSLNISPWKTGTFLAYLAYTLVLMQGARASADIVLV